MTKHEVFRSPANKRQTIVFVGFALVVLAAGIVLGSITPIGTHLRGWVYGGRGDLDFTTTQEIYGILSTDFDGTLDRAALQDGANAGVVAGTGDMFSRYLTPAEMTAFTKRMRGGTVGIGVELGFKNGNLVIIAPQDGSPAKQAGLQKGDIIISIDGSRVSDMSEQEAVQALRGNAGTSVRLTVQRGTEQLEFTITRQAIVIPSVRYSITDDAIGVMTITTFDANTGRLAAAAATAFQRQNVRGIVVDLRDNPGGAVTAAQDVLGLWLPKGSLVMTEKRNNTVLRTYKTTRQPVVARTPTVVLINGGSASASEIVAGALHEYTRATNIGEQSFGKGSVQEVRPLSNGGALSFTVSRWFTPKGRSIDGVGMTPDHIVALSRDDAAAGRDPQMERALQYLLR